MQTEQVIKLMKQLPGRIRRYLTQKKKQSEQVSTEPPQGKELQNLGAAIKKAISFLPINHASQQSGHKEGANTGRPLYQILGHGQTGGGSGDAALNLIQV